MSDGPTQSDQLCVAVLGAGGTIAPPIVRDLAESTCKTSPIPEWGLGGSVTSTSAPAAAAVRLMAKGKITARGAIPPEAAMVPQDMFDELASRNAEFSVTEYQPGGVQ